MKKQVKTHNLWSFMYVICNYCFKQNQWHSEKNAYLQRLLHVLQQRAVFSQSHIFLTNSLHITLLSAIWLGQSRGIFVASRRTAKVLDSRCFVYGNTATTEDLLISSLSVFPTIGGFPPKMDGENNGKAYFLMGWFEGKTPYFWKHPYKNSCSTGTAQVSLNLPCLSAPVRVLIKIGGK